MAAKYDRTFPGSRVMMHHEQSGGGYVLSARTGRYHMTQADRDEIYQLLAERRTVARVALLTGRSSSAVNNVKRTMPPEAFHDPETMEEPPPRKVGTYVLADGSRTGHLTTVERQQIIDMLNAGVGVNAAAMASGRSSTTIQHVRDALRSGRIAA